MKFLWSGLVILFLAASFFYLDLKPQVSENFFFSSDDPQLLADKKISGYFPQPPQIVIGAKGDIHSAEYLKKIDGLTQELAAVEGVVGVFSLTKGPRDPRDAFQSPLWKRFLIAKDGQATFISLLVEDVSMEKLIPRLGSIRDRWHAKDFEILFSGAPYITEQIRLHLLRDLKVFTFVSLAVFCAAIFAIFRSLRILIGCFVSCAGASVLALLAAQLLEIPVGPLTANLATIVFVLTLSHLVFLTFNWKMVLKEVGASHPVWVAVKMTFQASLWSMLTTLLGFFSLIFTHASPLRHLGISGSIGTLLALAVAYMVYPSFLMGGKTPVGGRIPGENFLPGDHFFQKRRPRVFLFVVFFAVIVSAGLWRINTDPTLFSYFREGGEIREGLEYVDKNGGSVPLRILVTDPNKGKLSTKDATKRLFDLHFSLEKDPAVGSVVSLPVLVAEARRIPWLSVVPTDVLVTMMEWKRFGAAARHFITPDRMRALFLLRMNESRRDARRRDVVERLKVKVKEAGFEPELVGGIYFLQGELSQLIARSVIGGLVLLILIFVGLTWFLSRSFRVAAAIAASLGLISVLMLGVVGLLRVPFDIISAPAVNITLGLGIDAMIHMLFFVRRTAPGEMNAWQHWAECGAHMWKPVLCSGVVLAAGFGVFVLSTFPPTQRFGASVVFGMGVASLVALFVFPVLASAAAKK